jgi:hypothetical protein
LFQAVSYQNTASLSLFQALSGVESKAMSQVFFISVDSVL